MIISWLRELDLNQRPFGYEVVLVLTNTPISYYATTVDEFDGRHCNLQQDTVYATELQLLKTPVLPIRNRPLPT